MIAVNLFYDIVKLLLQVYMLYASTSTIYPVVKTFFIIFLLYKLFDLFIASTKELQSDNMLKAIEYIGICLDFGIILLLMLIL
jgi:hypothetical protein